MLGERPLGSVCPRSRRRRFAGVAAALPALCLGLACAKTQTTSARTDAGPQGDSASAGRSQHPEVDAGKDATPLVPIQREDFPHALSEAHCTGVAGCCERSMRGSFASSCISTAEQHVQVPPTAAYDAQLAAGCVETIRRLLPKCDLRDVEVQQLKHACDFNIPAILGADAGEACGLCQPGLDCVDYGKQVEKVTGPLSACQHEQIVGLGEVCYPFYQASDPPPSVHFVCDPTLELSCDSGGSNRCIGSAAQRGPCELGCPAGEYCANTKTACAPIKSLHDACTASSECGPAAYCKSDTQSCENLPGIFCACEEAGGLPCANKLSCSAVIGSKLSYVCTHERTSSFGSCSGENVIWYALVGS
jgi:hypothetical protein